MKILDETSHKKQRQQVFEATFLAPSIISASVFGANDRINASVLGINGRGKIIFRSLSLETKKCSGG